MNEFFSNASDCRDLASKLIKEMGNKIDFYGTTYIEVPSGKYLSSYRRNQGEYMFNGKWLPFYFKFSEDEFLRIGVGSHDENTSLGERLAALSDFYKVLSEEYGDPTIFYTIKDDEKKELHLEWVFKNKEETIEAFLNGTYFDDGLVDMCIPLGVDKFDDTSNNFHLSDTTKRVIAGEVGLPLELLYLADSDIENFFKYKKGYDLPSKSKVRIKKYNG